MKKKRSSKRRARRAAVAKLRAATKVRVAKAAVRRLRSRRKRRRSAPSSGLGATPTSAANPSRKFWRVGKGIPWKNPSRTYWRVGQRKPWKNPRRRRNPTGKAVRGSGLMADFTGLGSALAAIAKQPMGLAWAGGGAALTAVGGNLVAAQVARVMPAMGAGMGRMLNAAVFAGVAVGASRLVKDPLKRRQMMAGGLAVAAIELLSPGKTYTVVARVPGLNRLLPASSVGADPAAMLAARGMSGYDNDDLTMVEDEPVAVDGIADDGEDSAALPAPDGSMGELVPTYLDGLGCPLTGRSNELTKLVTP